jgi:hypothetical protein
MGSDSIKEISYLFLTELKKAYDFLLHNMNL